MISGWFVGWLVFVVQKVEKVLLSSELQDKVVARRSKMAASVKSPTSHREERNMARLELAISTKQRYNSWRLL